MINFLFIKSPNIMEKLRHQSPIYCTYKCVSLANTFGLIKKNILYLKWGITNFESENLSRILVIQKFLEVQHQILMLMPALTTTFLFKIPTNCTRLVIYEYVEEFVEKIPQHFLEENKTHFFALELQCQF